MRISRLVAALAVTAVVAVPVLPAQANAPTKDTPRGTVKGGSDNLRLPFQVKQDALKQRVLEKRVMGEISPMATVAKVAKKRYVNLENEGTDRIFVVLAEFGNTRHASFPDEVDGEPASDAQTFDGPAAQRDPGAGPRRRQLDAVAGGLQPGALQGHVLQPDGRRTTRTQSSGRYSVDGARDRLGQGAVQRGALRPRLCGGIVCNNTWALDPRRAGDLGHRTSSTPGMTMAEIQAYLKHVRQAGPLRHRRRRQLQRAGRLHRPLPDRPRGRRRGRRRPDQGTDAIWSHRWYAAVLQAGGPGGARRRQRRCSGGVVLAARSIPEQPDRRLGRRLHDPAGERRPRRLRPRVRPRPRPARPLRHLRQHRWRREQHRLLDADEPPAPTSATAAPTGIGDAPTDLGAWEQFQLGWLDAQGANGPFYDVAHAGEKSTHVARPERRGDQASRRRCSSCCPDKQVPLELGDPRTRASKFFYSGSGDDLDNTMTQDVGITRPVR